MSVTSTQSHGSMSTLTYAESVGDRDQDPHNHHHFAVGDQDQDPLHHHHFAVDDLWRPKKPEADPEHEPEPVVSILSLGNDGLALENELDLKTPTVIATATTIAATTAAAGTIATPATTATATATAGAKARSGLDMTTTSLPLLLTPPLSDLDPNPETETDPESSDPGLISKPDPDPTIPGPMEHLVQTLLRKVADIERNRPTIMAEDYARLQRQVQKLEAEKHSWAEKYQAYFDVRDQDLTNLLRVRELLAQERREHTAIRQLRDEDLANVLMLREKLAQATWSQSRSRSRSAQNQYPTWGSPSAPAPASVPARPQSRTEGDHLWREAKAAAMEHRILELEAANHELRARVKMQTETAATEADRDRNTDKDISTQSTNTDTKRESGPGTSTGTGAGTTSTGTATTGTSTDAGILMRIQAMFEDSLRHREKMATRIQQLRSEKEALHKEMAGLEDRNLKLEGVVDRLKLQRSIAL